MTAPGWACGDTHCITCSDEGVVMRLERRGDEPGTWICIDDAGARAIVDLGLLGDLTEGARVLVHAGVAIAQSRGGAP